MKNNDCQLFLYEIENINRSKLYIIDIMTMTSLISLTSLTYTQEKKLLAGANFEGL